MHFFSSIYFLSIILFFILPISAIEKKFVEVIGAQNRQKSADPTGMVETIDREAFKGRYTQLTDVLEREAGLKIRRYGGLGSYSTLSIRGSNPNQVRIYMDGIPLNNSQGGEVNLSDLGFDNLEKIEVYKSGLTQGFTNSAIGGTVNLVTEKNQKKRIFRTTIGGGSFGTVKVGGFYADSTEKSTYSLFAQKEKSQQDFLFRSDNGTPVFNTLDDSDIKRRNAFFDRNNLTGKYSYEFDRTTLTVLNDFTYRQNGLPGPSSNQTEKVKREYIRNTTGLSTSTKSLYYDNLSLDTRLFYTGERDHLFDPLSEFSYGTPNSRADIQNFGLHVIPTISLLKYNQVLKFLFANERETFLRDKRNSFDERIEKSTRKFRSHTTIQIQDEIRLLNKKIILLPVVQREEYIDRFNDTPTNSDLLNSLQTTYKLPQNSKKTEFTNLRIGFKYLISQTDTWNLQWRMNASTEKRIPLFLEIFGERGSILGNTNLLPESSKNYDLGPAFEYKSSKLQLNNQISYFRKNIRDMILFIPNSQFSLRPENVDSADIKGLEWSIKMNLNSGWKFISNYTYQRAINTSNINYLKGKFLPLRPMHEWSAILGYKKNRWELGLESTFIGATFRDRTNEYANFQEARWIYGTYYNYKIFEQNERIQELMLGIEVRNILNYRTYDIIGYPLPGRSVYFTISAVF